VSECNLGNETYCPFVIRNTAGTITQVNTPSLNLAQLKTNGVDIEAQYALPLERIYATLPGTLNFGVLATYVAHLKTITATGSLDIAGETGCSPTSALLCVPDWTLDQTINYTVDKLSIHQPDRIGLLSRPAGVL
jgi:iron complex outermembrane receptor protein